MQEIDWKAGRARLINRRPNLRRYSKHCDGATRFSGQRFDGRHLSLTLIVVSAHGNRW